MQIRILRIERQILDSAIQTTDMEARQFTMTTLINQSRKFFPGEFVYDPESWLTLRSGMVSERNGQLYVWFSRRFPEEKALQPIDMPVSEYQGLIESHVLMNARSGRGQEVDPTPWLYVYEATLTTLRDAPGRQMSLEELISRLRNNGETTSYPIVETLKMMACMGVAEVKELKTGLVFFLSAHMRDHYDRVDYLATFSDELLIKSRRIDNLIRHTGTVGSYREQLLRSLLKQILPRQYEASTGFIEGCPRQIDILVWDSGSYSPLFREQDVVVVPRAAVRAAIEVKTTLDTAALDEAMQILWDTFRQFPSVVPVFKGIFAYEAHYKSDLAVAERMKSFYAAFEPDGIIEHTHGYLYAGTTAVCVPHRILVRERYRVDECDVSAFPQPLLCGISSSWPGDTKMPVFLGLLLAHLDLSARPKAAVHSLFDPLLAKLENLDLIKIYSENWRPHTAPSTLSRTLQPHGSQLHLKQVQEFLRGDRPAERISENLSESSPEDN